MDKKYWNDYYQKHGKNESICKHSTFATFCLENFFNQDNSTIVELGSGNGRDAIYFAHHNLNTIAIDQSIVAISVVKQGAVSQVKQYLHPKEIDFVHEDYSKYKPINIFYSRFTIHSITKEDEYLLLPNIYQSLDNGGLLCVEVRTINDPLYGVGEYCGDNTYLNSHHKRRFIDAQEFLNTTLSLGFKLLYFTEQNNLSIYQDDNPVLMRIILKKI